MDCSVDSMVFSLPVAPWCTSQLWEKRALGKRQDNTEEKGSRASGCTQREQAVQGVCRVSGKREPLLGSRVLVGSLSFSRTAAQRDLMVWKMGSSPLHTKWVVT